MIHGFSHVGVSTHNMEETISFYEGVLGFRRVVDDMSRIREGGALRQVFFDVGNDQYIVFMEAKAVKGIPDNYDTGINGALGTPAGMYHFALNVPTYEQLEHLREKLLSYGVDASDIIDLDTARSVFFSDPNQIQLELCWHARDFVEADLHRESEASIAGT